MGYQTTFRLKGELDNQFKTWMKSVTKSELTKYKVVLEGICMLPIEKTDNMRGHTYMYKLYDDINTAVTMYVNYIVESWKIDLKNRIDENNEIWFCGWEFSDSGNDSPWENKEDLVDFFTEQLFLYVIQPTSGAFDYKNDDYYDKLQKVFDNINDIDDSVYDMMNHKFVNRYRDSEDAYESDGYEHRFPEEKDEEEDEKEEPNRDSDKPADNE